MNHLDKLADFLEYLGVDIYSHKSQTVILDDAVITIHYDLDNLLTFSVELCDNVIDGKGNTLSDIFGDDVAIEYNEEFIAMENDHYTYPVFDIDSEVTVDGYSGMVFRVDGVSISYGHMNMYYLTSLNDGDYYEAFECDMHAYKSASKTKSEPGIDIDMLLDEYNDYIILYRDFGDKTYEEKASEILGVLRGIKG